MTTWANILDNYTILSTEKPYGTYWTQIPDSPGDGFTWNGNQWIPPDPVAIAEAQAVAYLGNGSKANRFLLSMFYNADQRLRVLEAKPAITKAQFLNGIKQLYKDS